MDRLSEANLEDRIIRHMRRDFVALRVDQTVGQALEQLRATTLAEKIIYFYVLDENQKLVGVVPTRRLLMSGLDVRLADIMVRNVISLSDAMSVFDGCEMFVMHRLLAFPVVDAENRMLGVVDAGLFTEEIFDVSERESAKDVFQLIGVRLADGRRASAWSGFKGRFPWLLCNIGGGIACAFVAGFYEQFLDSMMVLALFIPIVLTVSESVSMQSMSITLQGFHAGRMDWKTIFRSLRWEVATAALLSVACGSVVGLVALVWKRNAAIALALLISVALAIVTASVLGIMLPALIRLLRGDPKIAAGPIVLATADLLTLLFYFNVTAWMLK